MWSPPHLRTLAISVGVLVIAAMLGRNEAHAQIEEWRLGEPLQIGTVFGEPAYQFGDIGGAVQLSSGMIVVADRDADEIRFFDSGGHHRRSQGREGQGPAEYLFVRWIGECGPDSVFVVDTRQNRVTVLDADGSVVRMFEPPTPNPGRGPYRVDCDRQGWWVVAGWPDESALFETPEPGAHATTFTVVRASGGGQVLETLGSFAAGERVLTFSGGRVTGSMPRFFGAETHLAVGGGRIFVGDASTAGVVIYEDGREHTLSLPLERRPVADDDLTGFIRRAVERHDDPNRRRSARAYWAEYPFPAQYPYYSALHVDPDGNLWVRTYPRPDAPTVTWLIVAPDEGQLFARLATPADLEVTDIGRDYVLGIWSDENGVEYVRRHPLVKR